ncbi:hypothetical protein AB3X96_16000 [Paraburkholderia sp. BR13439]|uniref:hypothetical protein n=1 Tax=Paraburkholderia sp. BR13439 TaxID=3236996 RepID=UPI0034CD1B81
MSKAPRVQHPLPELLLTDRLTGNVERTGLDLIAARKREVVQRLDLAFHEGTLAALGVRPTEAWLNDMHARHVKVINWLFASVDEELRDGFSLKVTRNRQGHGHGADVIRAVQETFVIEYGSRASRGSTVTKEDLFRAIKKRHGIGRTKAREITEAIPWPPPSPRDEAERRNADKRVA